MTKEAIARQFFRDFLENLGGYRYIDDLDEYDEEESNQIITDVFFSGGLTMKWDPKKHTLMLKFTSEKEEDR